MKMIQAGLLFLATALGSLAWSKAGISYFRGTWAAGLANFT